METLLSLSGVAGAFCCVSMYAAVSLGRISAEHPAFFIVNCAGSILILIGAAHQFDLGDLGSVGQELIWAAISLAGLARVWLKSGGAEKIAAVRARFRRTAPAIAS